jgi:hypothetical protein
VGVHKKEVYAEVKRLLEIPEDEPIFILRAQDKLVPRIVDAYGQDYSNELASQGIKFGNASEEQKAFGRGIEKVVGEMMTWQDEHADRVKVPD